MRKLFPAFAALIFCCFLLSGTISCVSVQNTGQVQEPVTLSEVATAAAVTDEGKPLNTVTIFIASTPTIYVSTKVNNAPEGTFVSAVWVYVKNSEGVEVNQKLFADSQPVSGTRYLTFNHTAPAKQWQKGQYSIALSINGKEVTDAQFTVKDVLQADVPAPTITFFKAEPEAISFGQSVVLSWKTSDAAKVTVSPSVGVVPATGNSIVRPVITAEYTLTAINNSGTTVKKLTVEVTSFNSDKPELIISDFWIDKEKVCYKIKNIGGAEARESLTGIYINGVSAGQSKVEMLAPGQERSYIVPSLVWTYGSNRSYKVPVRICADDYGRVGEYDENNNCLVLDW